MEVWRYGVRASDPSERPVPEEEVVGKGEASDGNEQHDTKANKAAKSALTRKTFSWKLACQVGLDTQDLLMEVGVRVWGMVWGLV